MPPKAAKAAKIKKVDPMEVDPSLENNAKGKQVEPMVEEPMKTFDQSGEYGQNKEGFEPLAQAYYEGKHISEPVKEIKVLILMVQGLNVVMLNDETLG